MSHGGGALVFLSSAMLEFFFEVAPLFLLGYKDDRRPMLEIADTSLPSSNGNNSSSSRQDRAGWRMPPKICFKRFLAVVVCREGGGGCVRFGECAQRGGGCLDSSKHMNPCTYIPPHFLWCALFMACPAMCCAPRHPEARSMQQPLRVCARPSLWCICAGAQAFGRW